MRRPSASICAGDMPPRAITILWVIILSSAVSPTVNSSKIRTLWTLRGGVKNYSKNKTSVLPVVFDQPEGNLVPDEDENETTTPIPTTAPISLAMTGGQGRRRKRQLDLGEPVYDKRYPSLPKLKHSLPQKVAFTQVGYIQFIRYQIPVPELSEWTMCAWIRPKNLTYDCPIFSYSRGERERLIRVVVKPAKRIHAMPHVQLFVREQPIFDLALPEADAGRWFHLCSSWESTQARWHLYVDGEIRSWGKRPEARGIRIPAGGDIVLGQEYTDFNKGLDDGLEGEMYGFNLFSSATASLTSHVAWDPLSGDPLSGDPFSGDPLSGDPLSGDPFSGDPLSGDPRSGDHLSGDPRRRRRLISDLSDDDLEWTNLKASRTRSAGAGVPDRVARLFSRCVVSVRYDEDVVVSWPKTPMRVFGGAIIKNIRPICGAF